LLLSGGNNRSQVVRQFPAGCLAALFVLGTASAGFADEGEPEALPSAGCGTRPASPPESFTIAGTEREAIVVLPDDYDSDHPHPLVFGFHGRTNPNTQVRRYFGLEQATAMRAIYVYPQGLEDETGRFTWADPGDPADELRDYALFDEILDTMAEAYCVDLAAVFVAGHSLGATFANSVACARADVVRGVGSVAGGINPAECPEEVAALLLHNPRDEAVPVAEGERARDHLLPETDRLAATEPRSLGGFDCRQYSDGENPLLWCLYRQDMTRTGRFYPHQWPDGAGETIMRFFQDLRG
jgi:polyhydroxybutyrate depolymerase